MESSMSDGGVYSPIFTAVDLKTFSPIEFILVLVQKSAVGAKFRHELTGTPLYSRGVSHRLQRITAKSSFRALGVQGSLPMVESP